MKSKTFTRADVVVIDDLALNLALDALDTLKLIAADITVGSDLDDEHFNTEVLMPLIERLIGRERNVVGHVTADRRGSVRDLHCAMCGDVHVRNSLWCSESCRRQDKRALHKFFVSVHTSCERCSKPITAVHSDKRFCSASCRCKAWREAKNS